MVSFLRIGHFFKKAKKKIKSQNKCVTVNDQFERLDLVKLFDQVKLEE